jgi:hypothetical protein
MSQKLYKSAEDIQSGPASVRSNELLVRWGIHWVGQELAQIKPQPQGEFAHDVATMHPLARTRYFHCNFDAV